MKRKCFRLHSHYPVTYNIVMEKYRKFLILLLTIIAIVCLAGAGFLIIKQAQQDKHSGEYLDGFRNSAETASTKETTEATATESMEDSETIAPPETEATESATEETQLPTEEAIADSVEITAVPNPYAEAFSSNEDIVGWLQIPDTNIDYPVVWTPVDENYYLYKDIEGNEDKNGSLILDTDSSLNPLTTNLIIHGHNMRSGAMFGNLTDYEDFDYFKSHKYITLYTKECKRNYEVIAVFRSQVYKKSDTVFKFYKFFEADTQAEFEDFYHNIKDLSLYDTGVTAQFGDRFITLSTCVYHVEQGRFVVVAKEIEQCETYLPIQE